MPDAKYNNLAGDEDLASVSVKALSPVSTKASEETTNAKDVLAARMLLYEEARRTKDDTALKCFQKRLAAHIREKKEGATEVAKVLRKRALEEYHLDQKRATLIAEEKRLEAKDEDEQKTIRKRKGNVLNRSL